MTAGMSGRSQSDGCRVTPRIDREAANIDAGRVESTDFAPIGARRVLSDTVAEWVARRPWKRGGK